MATSPDSPSFLQASRYPNQNLLMGILVFRTGLELSLRYDEVSEDFTNAIINIRDSFKGSPGDIFRETLEELLNLGAIGRTYIPGKCFLFADFSNTHTQRFLQDFQAFYRA